MDCVPGINLLYGPNASGKSSVLEAIYYLAYGRSFRTHAHEHLIHHDTYGFTIFTRLYKHEHQIEAAIQRYRRQAVRIQIESKEARIVELAQLLPVIMVNSDSYLLLTAGATLRRKFVDWILFHVEPHFLNHWRLAQRVIKQRNRLLKQHPLDKKQLHSWDIVLVEVAHQLSVSRQRCLEQLMLLFERVWQQWGKKQLPEIEWRFYQGWPANQELKDVLQRSLPQDVRLGYSHYGPHRADLILRTNGVVVQDVLSRGQQKLLLYALKLAQGQLLETLRQCSCIYLLDDLPAELDARHCRLLVDALQSLSQFQSI